MARRVWADTWIYPTLQDLCAALSPLVQVPPNAELWFDVSDMPILREDAKDAADIMQLEATTVTTLVKEGFTAESAVAATKARDVSSAEAFGACVGAVAASGHAGAATERCAGRAQR